jgi:hypothetical protein
LAGNNKKLVKGRDTITSFINGGITETNAEYQLLSTLEYDLKAHDYIANYIANKRIDL